MTLRPTDSSALLIDGKLVPGSGGVFEVLAPATEEVVGHAAEGTAADMDSAIAAARRAFDETSWSRDHSFRARCLRQLRDALQSHIEELREITIAEVGAPACSPPGRSSRARSRISVLRRPPESYAWESDLGVAAPMGIRTRRRVLKEGVGVVGAVTPWNFPHQINFAKLGPALAAGTPSSSSRLPIHPGARHWSARSSRRRRHPGGRRQHRHLDRPSARRAARRGSTRRPDLLHRLHRDRQSRHDRGRTITEEGVPRAGREVRVRRPGRRRPRRRLRDRRVHGVHPCRSGVRDHDPCWCRARNATTTPSRPPPARWRGSGRRPRRTRNRLGPLISARQRARVESYRSSRWRRAGRSSWAADGPAEHERGFFVRTHPDLGFSTTRPASPRRRSSGRYG